MKLQSPSARLNNASATRLLRTGFVTTIRGSLFASVVPRGVLGDSSEIDKDCNTEGKVQSNFQDHNQALKRIDSTI